MKKLLFILIVGSMFAQESSPCGDETYLELKKKKLDKMSEREYQYFTTKDTACEQWRLNQQNLSKTVAIQEAATKRTIVRVIGIGCVLCTAIFFGGIFWI